MPHRVRGTPESRADFHRLLKRHPLRASGFGFAGAIRPQLVVTVCQTGAEQAGRPAVSRDRTAGTELRYRSNGPI